VNALRPSRAEGLGLPRSYLRPCLLLLLAEAPAHGYDLLEQVGRLGLERADPGGLYRCLRAMEEEGLVRSWWEHSPSGPARRTYDLTDEGLDWLHAWAGSLREVHRTLGRYLRRYEAVTDRATQATP
jgi:PadR family transcriptional regulator, regulatory protein PadR